MSTIEPLRPLERRAIRHALATADFKSDCLLKTVDRLIVQAREYTGVGFFVKFVRDPSLSCPGLDEVMLRKRPPAVYAFHPGISGVADFLVWIKDGQIDCFEANATSTWPADDSIFKFEGEV